MQTSRKTLRTCDKGHQYYKSSDCPACPICEQERKPQEGFLSVLSAPARRALERENIATLQDLANYSEQELLKLHGFGQGSIPRLLAALAEKGLTFKNRR
ncbi:RNA polymerase alpha subunit C-terminal domain-containing protein [Parapedobacter sp. DT-150]|uniref:RNA polymerase alpha subunit C-terminal domain-containing protein n=1 Tax=Parapedobacter sp. DT-150 TaxID=3396162 RepID=UPI003F1DF14F